MSSTLEEKLATPLVSIGLPVHNGATFLKQAIDSLLTQSLSDLELIISDNASTDATERICRDFAERDQRIKYYRQARNIGAPGNWNFVAQMARGKYFKWSSANDYCAPDMLAKCVAVMEAAPGIVLCYGRTCLIDEETGERKKYEGDLSIVERLPHERFRMLCRRSGLNNAQSGLIRTDALRRTRLDRPYPGGDKALMAELVLQGHFVLLPDVLLYRRLGRETFSSLLNSSEMQYFFNPASRGSVSFRYFRLHIDFFMTVFWASISLPEKLRILLLVGRHAAWDREKLWTELRSSLSRSQHV